MLSGCPLIKESFQIPISLLPANPQDNWAKVVGKSPLPSSLWGQHALLEEGGWVGYPPMLRTCGLVWFAMVNAHPLLPDLLCLAKGLVYILGGILKLIFILCRASLKVHSKPGLYELWEGLFVCVPINIYSISQK